MLKCLCLGFFLSVANEAIAISESDCATIRNFKIEQTRSGTASMRMLISSSERITSIIDDIELLPNSDLIYESLKELLDDNCRLFDKINNDAFAPDAGKIVALLDREC